MHSIRTQLRGSEHLLDLSIGTAIFRPGAAMFDGVLSAGISKRMNPEEAWRQLFDLFLGRAGSGVLSTKCVLLSASTVWIVYGIATIKAVRKSAEIRRVARS
jgi:hypothetical protein